MKTPTAEWATRRYELQRKKRADRRADKRAKADTKHATRARNRKTRAARWNTIRDGFQERLPFLAMLTMVVFCTSVAVPAQIQWFTGHITVPIVPIAATGMLEGATWYFAVLYYRSVRDARPNKTFHTLILVAATVAAAINFQHGLAAGSFILGVVYAMGSVLGVGAFELYMLHTRKVVSGMTGDELRLWSLRARRFPRIMWRATRYRAVYGLRLPMEHAWRMAYVATRGAPPIAPVMASDPIVTHLTGTHHGGQVETIEAVDGGGSNHPEPGSNPTGGDHPEVWNLPVGWDDMTVYADMFNDQWHRHTGMEHPSNGSLEHPPEHPDEGGVPDTSNTPDPGVEHPTGSNTGTPALPSQNTRNTPHGTPPGTPSQNTSDHAAEHPRTSASNGAAQGRSRTVPREQNTAELAPAEHRRHAVIAEYWRRWNQYRDDPDAGSPNELTPADVLGALSLDQRSRPLVSKTLAECRDGKHPDPTQET